MSEREINAVAAEAADHIWNGILADKELATGKDIPTSPELKKLLVEMRIRQAIQLALEFERLCNSARLKQHRK